MKKHKTPKHNATTSDPTVSDHTRAYRSSRGHKKSRLTSPISIIAILGLVIFVLNTLGLTSLSLDTLSPDSLSAESRATTVSAPAIETHTAITGDAQIDRTLALIQQGGPYPYPNKDGSTFYNREGRLPAQPRGYYREYTVPTPGVSHRGARRIVTGGQPPTVYYLTIDHYESFRQLQVP